MTGEVDRLKIVKDQLDSVSRSYCTAKWLQVTLHLQNGRTHSCHHPSTHKIPENELKNNPSSLHNTSFKKKQRLDMLNGVRPKECQYCWNIEDLPGDHISDRVIKSGDYTWSLDKLEELPKTRWDSDVFPTYVEVSFSNHCNLKCSYCGPVHSSRWAEESKKYGPYPTSQYFNGYDWLVETGQMPYNYDEYNPYVDAFWEWWPELHKNLKVFRLTGGEPLMDKNTFRILDYLLENKNDKLEFSVNTNACVSQRIINSFLEKMKNIIFKGNVGQTRIYTSVDGHGAQAEYGRHGLDYNLWLNNVDKILTELPTTKITIMCTSNIFTVSSLGKLLVDVYNLKVKHHHKDRLVPVTLDMSVLRWPGHQRANILPEKYFHTLYTALEYMRKKQEGNKEENIPHYLGFFDFEIAKLERFIEFATSPVHIDENLNIESARVDFYKFVSEHDKRRETNFLTVFPEYEDFYKECEVLSNKYIAISK